MKVRRDREVREKALKGRQVVSVLMWWQVMKVYNVSMGVKKGMRKFFCSNCHMHQRHGMQHSSQE